jgi:hypothetical protein
MQLGRCEFEAKASSRGAVLVTVVGGMGYADACMLADELRSLHGVQPYRGLVLDGRECELSMTLAEFAMLAPRLAGRASIVWVAARGRRQRARQAAAMMGACGVDVSTASSLEEARQLLRALQPDAQTDLSPIETDFAPL